jgi:hypothetical protein
LQPDPCGAVRDEVRFCDGQRQWALLRRSQSVGSWGLERQLGGEQVQREVGIDQQSPQPLTELVDHQAGCDASSPVKSVRS